VYDICGTYYVYCVCVIKYSYAVKLHVRLWNMRDNVSLLVGIAGNDIATLCDF